MSTLRLTVASWADREDLVIELTQESDDSVEEWGLVTFEPDQGGPVIELYPRLSGDEWHFDLDELSAILAIARDRIVEVAGPEAREAMLAAQREHAAATAS